MSGCGHECHEKNQHQHILWLDQLILQHPRTDWFGAVQATCGHPYSTRISASDAQTMDKQQSLHDQLSRGDHFNSRGDYARAVACYTKAVEIDAGCTVAFTSRGEAYTAQGMHDLAVADFRRAIALEPDNPALYVFMGDCHHAVGDYEQAIASYTRAIEMDPDEATYWSSRGDSYHCKGDYDLAVADFTRAILLDPNDELAYVSRAMSCRLQGNYPQAILDCTKAVELNPRDPIPYNSRGVALHFQGKYEMAVANFTRAIELDPNFANPYTRRGRSYLALGNHVQALVDCTHAIDINPRSSRFYGNRAYVRLAHGDYDNAIADASRAIEIEERNVAAYCYRGIALEGKRMHAEALRDFVRAGELSPRDAESNMELEKIRGHYLRCKHIVEGGSNGLTVAHTTTQHHGSAGSVNPGNNPGNSGFGMQSASGGDVGDVCQRHKYRLHRITGDGTAVEVAKLYIPVNITMPGLVGIVEHTCSVYSPMLKYRDSDGDMITFATEEDVIAWLSMDSNRDLFFALSDDPFAQVQSHLRTVGLDSLAPTPQLLGHVLESIARLVAKIGDIERVIGALVAKGSDVDGALASHTAEIASLRSLHERLADALVHNAPPARPRASSGNGQMAHLAPAVGNPILPSPRMDSAPAVASGAAEYPQPMAL
eukprot:Opistho-2@64473